MEHEYLRHISRLDEAGLRDVMESYGQSVWDYAYILTKNRYTADDVSQDVFLKAYQQIGSFRGESSFKTWLLTITRNTAFNYRRSAFLRRVVLMDRLMDRQTSPSAEKEFLGQAYADDLWEKVMALPAKYREPLLLEAKYELSMKDMAELLGLSEGTVKSRLHRARKKLEEALKEESDYETV